MITWIKSVLPRIKKYAVNLDKTELLVDKTWVWIGFQEGYSTFHFLRDNRLLITNLGNVHEGQWEFIGSELLHVKGGKFNVMLKHGILFEGVLIIQKQGVPEGYELFYDEAIIPDGDVIRYVNSKLEIQEPKIQHDYPITVFNNLHELTFPSQPEIGLKIISNPKEFSGKVKGLPSFIGVIVENDIIVAIFYEALIETDKGEIEIEIENLNWTHPKGSAIMTENKEIPNGKFNVLTCKPTKLDWKTISLKNGRLYSVGYIDNPIIIAIVCGMLFLAILIGLAIKNS